MQLRKYTGLNDRRGVVPFGSLSHFGEGRGEGLARNAQNNSPGFSPLSRTTTTGQFFNHVDAAKNSWVDCGLKPAATFWLDFELRPSPQPSPKWEREPKRYKRYLHALRIRDFCALISYSGYNHQGGLLSC